LNFATKKKGGGGVDAVTPPGVLVLKWKKRAGDSAIAL
jgi:hypothetical protein